MSTLAKEKDPDVATVYEIDVFEQIVVEAYRSHRFEVDDVVRAPKDTGFFYVCQTAGRTGDHYPQYWPRAASETVADGSVVWNTVHPDSAGPTTIQIVTWIMPTGLTLDSQSEANHVATATISGGTADVDYDVTARITPTVGPPIDVTITIPVRNL